MSAAARPRRVLLIGATGEFGGRLARGLARMESIDLILTSREGARAEALARTLRQEATAASLEGIAFERGSDAARMFADLRPWLVIDASGPFQELDYATARAALDARTHWIDLADAEDYLLGFEAALDGLACANGVTALAGASSTPALSFAVVEDLTRDWKRIDTVDLAIYPAGNAPVGRAVIEAVLSYAGRPVPVWRDGARGTVTGWGRAEARDVPELGRRFASPVATADWALISRHFGVTSRVTFCAGLGVRLEHFGLVALAQLVRRGWIRNAARLAPLLQKSRRLTRAFAADMGGMTVDIKGEDATGMLTRARWWLVAKKGDGPNVPVLAAIALTRRLLDGALAPGARPASGSLPLALIEAEMLPFALRTARSSTTLSDRGAARIIANTSI